MKTILLLICAFTMMVLQGRTQTVTDYDGNVYQTVVINNQEWMKQNLKVTHYLNGILIPQVTNAGDWGKLTSGARCYYNNDSIANDSVYGALYNWYAVNDTGNICPKGWHIPTHAEWTSLENFLGGWEIAGGKMKEAGLLHWKSPNIDATNSTSFTGLPGGFRGLSNTFEYIGENGLWWTSTEQSGLGAWSRYQWYMQGVSDANPIPKTAGLSIRCIKNSVVGNEQGSQAPRILIYPNPSKGILSINVGSQQAFSLTIYNAIGETMLQKEFSNATEGIDIHHLAGGWYLIRISTDVASVVDKLIVE